MFIRKVRLFSISDDETIELPPVALHPDRRPHIVGAMAWGSHSSSNHLFASSEPYDPRSVLEPSFDGVHKVYDIHKRTVVYQFDATEAGDSLCVDQGGMWFEF